jgi:serine acetyltransferase
MYKNITFKDLVKQFYNEIRHAGKRGKIIVFTYRIGNIATYAPINIFLKTIYLSIYLIMNTVFVKTIYGCEFPRRAQLDWGLRITHPNGIFVNPKTKSGKNLWLYNQVTIGDKDGEAPILGNDIIIYPGARCIGGINIGSGSKIASNAVCNKNFEEKSLIGGIPATKIKSL